MLSPLAGTAGGFGLPGDAPGFLTLSPRTGPPIDALGEGRAGVIWVLLLATPTFGEVVGSASLLLPGSRALIGAVIVGVVLDRSTPADFGPSASSIDTIR
jgi:hypothetical protein